MNAKSLQKSMRNMEVVLDKNYNAECGWLLQAINNSILEIEEARNIFNNVDEFHLIELAIYSENVARKRYEYLLSIAKKKGICVTGSYLLKNNLTTFQ